MGHYDEQRDDDAERARLYAAMRRSPKFRAKLAMNSATLILECPFCEGEKRVYDPTVPRDCIEGNKMRPLITCNACDGKGNFPRGSPKGAGTIAYWRVYTTELAKEKKQKKEERAAHFALLQGAYAKLTDAEVIALELTKPEGV